MPGRKRGLSHREGALLAMLAGCGFRLAELRTLRWHEVENGDTRLKAPVSAALASIRPENASDTDYVFPAGSGEPRAEASISSAISKHNRAQLALSFLRTGASDADIVNFLGARGKWLDDYRASDRERAKDTVDRWLVPVGGRPRRDPVSVKKTYHAAERWFDALSKAVLLSTHAERSGNAGIALQATEAEIKRLRAQRELLRRQGESGLSLVGGHPDDINARIRDLEQRAGAARRAAAQTKLKRYNRLSPNEQRELEADLGLSSAALDTDRVASPFVQV